MTNSDGKGTIILIVISILVLWVVTPIILSIVFDTAEAKGLFGDSFGALNSLFSGLAFAGVIIAILLQRNELKLQREELELTRTELSRSASAQEESGSVLGEQSEVMKVTAELNGLASLIQARTGQIQYLADIKTSSNTRMYDDDIAALQEKRNKDIESLELLMHGVFAAAERNEH